MKKEMSVEELLKLPAAVDLDTAGRAFGMGHTKAFQLARDGEFPVPVLKVGKKFRVTKTSLLKALGFEDVLAAQAARSLAEPPASEVA